MAERLDSKKMSLLEKIAFGPNSLVLHCFIDVKTKKTPLDMIIPKNEQRKSYELQKNCDR